MYKAFCFFFLLILSPPSNGSTKTISPLLCTFTGIGEILIPGLGYAITGQYGMAVGFGLARFAFKNESARLSLEPDFQLYVNQYYVKRTITDKDINEYDFLYERNKGADITFYSYNKSTYDAYFYSKLDFNLGTYSYWNLVEGNCQENAQWSEPFLAFGDYKRYGTSPLFLSAVGILITVGLLVENNNVSIWHLGNGLTMTEVKQKDLIANYSTGIGEETLFRGSFQKRLYQWYKTIFNENQAWHAGIITSAAIFGLAHDGAANTATNTQAFLAGIYLGYTYQPSPEQFNLSTAIVLHSFFNSFVSYLAIKNSREVRHLSKGEYKNTTIKNAETTYPLMRVEFSF